MFLSQIRIVFLISPNMIEKIKHNGIKYMENIKRVAFNVYNFYKIVRNISMVRYLLLQLLKDKDFRMPTWDLAALQNILIKPTTQSSYLESGGFCSKSKGPKLDEGGKMEGKKYLRTGSACSHASGTGPLVISKAFRYKWTRQPWKSGFSFKEQTVRTWRWRLQG